MSNRFQDSKKRSELTKIFRDKNRLTILLYMQKYQTLSFKQIREIIGKSKTTTHYHIQMLCDAGILEVNEDIEDKDHGNLKFYHMPEFVLNFGTPTQTNSSSDGTDGPLLSGFDFNQFYLTFMLTMLQRTVDEGMELFDRLKDLELRFQEEPNSQTNQLWKQINNQVQSYIDNSKFFAFPLSKDEYDEYLDQITKYHLDYMKKLDTRVYSESEGDLYWVMAFGTSYRAQE